MRFQLVIVGLLMGWLLFTVWMMDREQKARKRKQRQLEMEWNFRRAIGRRQTWPKP